MHLIFIFIFVFIFSLFCRAFSVSLAGSSFIFRFYSMRFCCTCGDHSSKIEHSRCSNNNRLKTTTVVREMPRSEPTKGVERDAKHKCCTAVCYISNNSSIKFSTAGFVNANMNMSGRFLSDSRIIVFFSFCFVALLIRLCTVCCHWFFAFWVMRTGIG